MRILINHDRPEFLLRAADSWRAPLSATSFLASVAAFGLFSGTAYAQTEAPASESDAPAETAPSPAAPSSAGSTGEKKSTTVNPEESEDEQAPASPPRAAVAPQARRLSRARRGPPSATTAPASARRSPPSAAKQATKPAFRYQSPAPQPRSGDPARDVSAQESTPKDKAPAEAPSGLRVLTDLTTSLGSGTFTRGSEFSRNPYYDYAVTLMPAWVFKNQLQLQVLMTGLQELTDSDTTTEKRQFLLSDLRWGVRAPLHSFKETKTSIIGEFFDHLPTSVASRGSSLVTALQARITVAQPVGDFFFTLRSSFRKNFHQYTSPVVDVSEGGLATCLARDGGNERVDALTCSAGGNNTSFTFNNRLLALYPATEKLSFIAMYTLAHSYTYEDYDSTSGACDSTDPLDCVSQGVGAQDGRGRRDTQVGIAMASYQASPALSFSLGVSTLSSPRSLDDQRIRFPFFATEGANSNLTSYFLSVSLLTDTTRSSNSNAASPSIVTQ